MQHVFSTLLLICAAIGSLAFGVMLAYGICNGAFRVLKLHARSYTAALQPRPRTAALSSFPRP